MHLSIIPGGQARRWSLVRSHPPWLAAEQGLGGLRQGRVALARGALQPSSAAAQSRSTAGWKSRGKEFGGDLRSAWIVYIIRLIFTHLYSCSAGKKWKLQKMRENRERERERERARERERERQWRKQSHVTAALGGRSSLSRNSRKPSILVLCLCTARNQGGQRLLVFLCLVLAVLISSECRRIQHFTQAELSEYRCHRDSFITFYV